jgi:4-amino-4-deoxy-L-arabinose transferase-like glycosyltransferase
VTDNGTRTEFFATHPDSGLVRWLRVPNIAMGALTVLVAFFTIRRLTDDRWTPLVGAATLAFLPRFVFLSPFVTNDNLVVLLGSVLTYCAIRFVQRPSTRWMLAAGAVLGLLLTTKLSVLPLILLIPVLAAFAPSWRQRALQLGWGYLSTAAVCSWYLVQNWVRYGDPLARSASTKYLTAIGALGVTMGKPYVVADPANLVLDLVPKRLVTSFWYSSGWGQFHWSASIGFLVTCGVLALLVGLIHQRIPIRVLVVLGSIAALSLACVWLLAFQTATAYGARYAYVGITAIIAVVALSVQRWPVLLRWLLPAACLVGTILAIHSDVLEIHWT